MTMEKKQVYISVYDREVYIKADQYEINEEAGVVMYHEVSEIEHDDGDTSGYEWEDCEDWEAVELNKCFISEDWEAVVRHTTERSKREQSVRDAKKKDWLKRFNDLVKESRCLDYEHKDFEDLNVYDLPYKLRRKIVEDYTNEMYYKNVLGILKTRTIRLPQRDDFEEDNVPDDCIHISHIVAVSEYRRSETSYIRYEFDNGKYLELHATEKHYETLRQLKEAWAILGV